MALYQVLAFSEKKDTKSHRKHCYMMSGKLSILLNDYFRIN